jgi:hypothetical protein
VPDDGGGVEVVVERFVEAGDELARRVGGLASLEPGDEGIQPLEAPIEVVQPGLGVIEIGEGARPCSSDRARTETGLR